MSCANDWLSSDVLLGVLREHPEGISEHALLTWLQQQTYIHIESDGFHDMMKLFRVHFMLFHRLYRLRDELHSDRVASLSIHTLCIRLLPYTSFHNTSDQGAVVAEDPLRQYYLNLDHLTHTDEVELDAMLNGFWTSFSSVSDNKERREALARLDLNEEASDQQIKQAWRRLAMQHHPDRGGDEEHIKALNHAVSVLLTR